MTYSSCFRLGCLKSQRFNSTSNEINHSASPLRSNSGVETETAATNECVDDVNVLRQNVNATRAKASKIWWKKNVTKNYRLVEIAPGIVTLPPSSMETLYRFLNFHGSETDSTTLFNVNAKGHGRSQKDSLFNTCKQIFKSTSEAINDANKDLGENFMLFDCGYQDKIPETYRCTSSANRSVDVGHGNNSGDVRSGQIGTASALASTVRNSNHATTTDISEEAKTNKKEPLVFPRFESPELFGKENVKILNHGGAQSSHVTVKSIIGQANRIILWLRLKSAEMEGKVTEQREREQIVSNVCDTSSPGDHGAEYKHLSATEKAKAVSFKALVVGSSEEHHILLLATLTLLLYASPSESSVTHKEYMIDTVIRLNEFFASSSWSLPFSTFDMHSKPKDKNGKIGYMKRIASFGSTVDNEYVEDYDLVNKKIAKLERTINWEHPFSVDVALSIAEVVMPQFDLQQIILSKSSRHMNLSERFHIDAHGRDVNANLDCVFGEEDLIDWRYMHLRTVVFSHLPRICKPKEKGQNFTCRPYLMITNGDGSNVIYSSLVSGIKEITYTSGDPVVFEVNCRVKGDICLKVYHLPAGAAGIMLFQTHVHTATAEPVEVLPNSTQSQQHQQPENKSFNSMNSHQILKNVPNIDATQNREQLIMLRKRPHIEWSMRSSKGPSRTLNHSSLVRIPQLNPFSRRPQQRRRRERYRSSSGFGNEDLSDGASSNGKKNWPFDPDFEVQLVLGMPPVGRKQSRIGPLVLSPSQYVEQSDIEWLKVMRDGYVSVHVRPMEKIKQPTSAIVKPLHALSLLPTIQVKCPLLACGAIDYYCNYLCSSREEPMNDTGLQKMTCPKCGFTSCMPKYLDNYLYAVMEDIDCRNELSGSDTEEDDDDDGQLLTSDTEPAGAKTPEEYDLPFSDAEEYAVGAGVVSSESEERAHLINESIDERFEVLCDMFHRFPKDQLKRLMDEALASCDLNDPSAVDNSINALVADILIPRNQFVSIERIKTPFGNGNVVEWKLDLGKVVAQLEWGGRITMNISELDLDLSNTEASFAAELQRDADRSNSISAVSQLEHDEVFARSLQGESGPVIFPRTDSIGRVVAFNEISQGNNHANNYASDNNPLEGNDSDGDGNVNQSYGDGSSGATINNNESNSTSSTSGSMSASEIRQRQSNIAEAQSILERIRAMDDTSQDFDHRFEMMLNLRSLLESHHHSLSSFASQPVHRSSHSFNSEVSSASPSARTRQMRIGWTRYGRTGASQSSIDMLPVHYFTKKGDKKGFSEATANKCMICQYEYVDDDGLRTLPCIHTYHVECIDPWLRRSKACPVCQREIDLV